MTEKRKNPLDIDSDNFDCDAYLSKTLRDNRLETLLDKELSMAKDARTLNCEMEQLVYENYNKFITATDTIRQMQTDFVHIEQEMDKLASNMHKISSLSDRLGGSLSTKRDNVNKLARANRTLKNLQFLFDLPATLQTHLDSGNYDACAKSYSRMTHALDSYKSAPALQGIRKECDDIVEKLRAALYQKLSEVGHKHHDDSAALSELDAESSTSQMNSTKAVGQAVESLLLLGESPAKLSHAFIQRAELDIANQMRELFEEIELKTQYNAKIHDAGYNIDNENDIIKIPVDVLEFVDNNVSALLGSFSLTCTSYTELFSRKSDEHFQKRLEEFASKTLTELIEACEQRFMLDIDVKDSAMLVRALDRFYRRLTVNGKLLPNEAASAAQQSSVDMLQRVGDRQIEKSLNYLVAQAQSHIKLARTQIVRQV